MIIECGSGYILYISSEEFFALNDSEFEELLNTRCFPATDPYYASQKNINFIEGTFDEDIPSKEFNNINDIINALNVQSLDTTDLRNKIFLDIDESMDLLKDIEEDECSLD